MKGRRVVIMGAIVVGVGGAAMVFRSLGDRGRVEVPRSDVHVSAVRAEATVEPVRPRAAESLRDTLARIVEQHDALPHGPPTDESLADTAVTTIVYDVAEVGPVELRFITGDRGAWAVSFDSARLKPRDFAPDGAVSELLARVAAPIRSLASDSALYRIDAGPLAGAVLQRHAGEKPWFRVATVSYLRATRGLTSALLCELGLVAAPQHLGLVKFKAQCFAKAAAALPEGLAIRSPIPFGLAGDVEDDCGRRWSEILDVDDDSQPANYGRRHQPERARYRYEMQCAYSPGTGDLSVAMRPAR